MIYKCYPISNVWLNSEADDAPEYVDIDEIRCDPHNNVPQPDDALQQPPNHPSSEYLTWVLKHDKNVFTKLDGTNPTRMDHIRESRFKDIGTRVGNTDGGENLIGVIKDGVIKVTGQFREGIVHGEVFRRIYKSGTTARGIWFLGY